MPRQQDVDLDLSVLADIVDEKKGRLPLKRALASGKFAQVGINLFRHQENNTIWQLETAEDGADYIIRAEPNTDDSLIVESSDNGEWTAISDSTKENVTLSHRNVPLRRFAAKDHGFTSETVREFQRYLLTEVEDKAFADSIYVDSTGECPLCNAEATSLSLRKISCTNSKCKYGAGEEKEVGPSGYSMLGEKMSIPVYTETGEFRGDFNAEKVNELVDRGILKLENTPKGTRAVRIRKL